MPSVLGDTFPEVFFFIDRGECALGYPAKVGEFYLRVQPGGAVRQTLVERAPDEFQSETWWIERGQ